MKPREHLEDQIRRNYEIIRDFDDRITFASDAKEKGRYRAERSKQLKLLQGLLSDYSAMAINAGFQPSKDIQELNSAFGAESPASTQKTTEGEEESEDEPTDSAGSVIIERTHTRKYFPSGELAEETVRTVLKFVRENKTAIALAIAFITLLAALLGVPAIRSFLSGLISGNNPTPIPTELTATPTVTLSSFEAATSLPAQSNIASPVPSIPESDDSTQQTSDPCIAAGSNRWRASWLSGGGVSPPTSRQADKIACFDFSDEGFAVMSNNQVGEVGMQIVCGDQDSPCAEGEVLRGIFAPLHPGSYPFEIEIDELGILGSGEALNDVDLLIGVGDPADGKGLFVLFRLVNPRGSVHFCTATGVQEYCNPITTTDLDSFGTHEIGIVLGESLQLSVDGTQVASMDELGDVDPFIWIGYGFRSEGHISAFVGFPESLEYLFVPE